jgi:hypothetical protein
VLAGLALLSRIADRTPSLDFLHEKNPKHFVQPLNSLVKPLNGTPSQGQITEE